MFGLVGFHTKRYSLTELFYESGLFKENLFDVKKFVMECNTKQFCEKMEDKKFRDIIMNYLVSKNRNDIVRILKEKYENI